MLRTLPRSIRILRNVIIAGALAAGYLPAKRALHRYMYSDALLEFRHSQLDPTPDYFIRLNNVKMRHYDAHKLVSYAHCDALQMSTDQRKFELNTVHDALYRGDDGEFKYRANHAVYLETGSQMNADGDVHILNKDMDLHSQALSYNGNSGHMTINTHVTGTLKGGKIDADHVDYRLTNGSYRAGPVAFNGPVDLELGLPQESNDPPKPTKWNIQGETMTYSGRDSQIATYSNAVASDGEIILIAPNVVHDRKADVLTAKGRIQYFSAKADLVADQCVVYRKEKRAVLTGNVLMLAKPKSEEDGKPKVEKLPPFQPLTPDQVIGKEPEKIDETEKKRAENLRETKTIRDFPMVIASAKIEYWYGKGSRRAVITGSPQGRQELPENQWRHMWTNVAFYDGEKERLRMVSTKDKRDTRLKNSIGDDVSANWMEVSTKEGDDEMSGHGFIGSLAALDEDYQRDKKKPSDGAPVGSKKPNPPKTPPP